MSRSQTRFRAWRFLSSPLGRPGLNVEALEVRRLLAVDVATVELTLTQGQTVTDANGEVAALPTDATFVDEWDALIAEVWVAVPDEATGVADVAVDLEFDAALLEVAAVHYGDAFTETLPTEPLDPVAGVELLMASSAIAGAGVDGFALLARVELRTLEIPVNVDLRLIGPNDMGLGLSNASIEAEVGSSLAVTNGDMPETELWANFYDLDEDDRVGFSDLAIFTLHFLNVVDETPDDRVWWADFDKSGQVGFSDLALFTANFLRAGPQDNIIFPGNFPEAWRKTPIEPTNLIAAAPPEADAQAPGSPALDTGLVGAAVHEVFKSNEEEPIIDADCESLECKTGDASTEEEDSLVSPNDRSSDSVDEFFDDDGRRDEDGDEDGVEEPLGDDLLDD